MVFSSLTFCFFILPLFLFFNYLSKNTSYRNIVLILVSILFYTWGEDSKLTVLICYGVINYAFGYFLELFKAKSKSTAFIFLIVFVTCNLLGLIYYKYTYWLFSFITFLDINFVTFFKNPTLPIGISFFTFHAISYLIDIYRGELSGKNKVSNFLTYFFMFPHLVAGPIVRYKDIEPQLNYRENDLTLFNYGLYRFILGINKKLLIANSVAPIADTAFSTSLDLSLCDSWLGALAYTIQIYFDFSAYSDMAIGLAAMAGIKFKENFNSPYKSKSVKEFWRRWHISLSSWLRDYVYIPIGGSRVGVKRTYLNLCLVFLLCGIWHGASLTFVLWGLYHGLFLIIERVFGSKIDVSKVPYIIKHGYCLLAVIIGWVIFRAENLDQAFSYIGRMFTFESFDKSFALNYPCYSFNVIALVVGSFISLFSLKAFSSNSCEEKTVRLIPYILNAAFLVLSLAVLYLGAKNPFIYFNF